MGALGRPLLFALAGPACLAGCFLKGIVPDLKTPAERAQEVVGYCATFAEETRIATQPALVEAVEPAYSYVHASMLREPRLRGASLRLRPTAGLSRESLQRGLDCHQAQVVLGMEPARDDDPYFLPGVWLDIEADSARGGFSVAVRATAYADAKDVLQRARLFKARP